MARCSASRSISCSMSGGTTGSSVPCSAWRSWSAGAATGGAPGGLAFTESAQVKVLPTGSVTLFTGASPHGQGHETTFAQIAADALGVAYDAIDVRHGDTAEGPAMASGTYGSRSLAVGGMA